MGIEKIEGIVTDIVRHNDKHNVVSIFTRSKGMVSFLSPAGGGKRGKARNARLQLMSVVESEVNFRETKDLQTLGTVSLREVWHDLYFNPVKTGIVMFMAEFLHRYLRESSAEPFLWDYVCEALRLLDMRKRGCGNFHLGFLIGFLPFAGVQPDIHDLEEGDYFDMRGGVCVAERPGHRDFLYPSETIYLHKLMRMNVHNDRLFRFKIGERRVLLEKLLHYYSIHFPGLGNLKTPGVLGEIFS